MRILAIDYGNKHTGFALGENGFSMPFDQITTTSNTTIVQKVQQLIKAENIGKLVVGFPISYNNLKIQKNIKDFITLLSESVKLPIELVEEDYTSKEAFTENFEKFSDIKHIKKIIHKTSAEKILQNYYLSNLKNTD